MTARLCLVLPLLLLPACSGGPTPQLKYAGAAGGCADIFVYKGDATGREYLVVWTDRTKLKLPDEGEVAFDLAKSPAGLNVSIDLWNRKPEHLRYCNDIADDEKKLATWTATAGQVTITTHGPVPNQGGGPRRYTVTVKLANVVFSDGAGRTVTLPSETFADVVVGWYAG